MNKLKTFMLVTIITPTLIFADLEAVAQKVSLAFIEAGTKIALNSKGKILLNDVTINCKFNADESILLGSGCVELRANDIKAFNLKINSDVTMRRSFMSGSAVYIGK